MRPDRGLVARDGARPEENSAEGKNAAHAPEVGVIGVLVKQPWRQLRASDSRAGMQKFAQLDFASGVSHVLSMSTDRCILPLERAFPIAGT